MAAGPAPLRAAQGPWAGRRHASGRVVDHSAVADGASTLIDELFGPERGRHARTSVGVAQLPRNGCVELDPVVALGC